MKRTFAWIPVLFLLAVTSVAESRGREGEKFRKYTDKRAGAKLQDAGRGAPVLPRGTVDDHGNSCATATVIQPGLDVAGSLETPGDLDYFKFTLTSPMEVRLRTTGGTDTFGTLLDAGCSVITSNDDHEGLNFQVSRVLDPGDYHLEIRHFSQAGTGSYVLEFLALVSDELPDFCESAGQGVPVTASADLDLMTDYAGDRDVLELVIDTPTQFSATSDDATVAGATLFDGSCNPLIMTEAGSGVQLDTPLGPGEYRLRVDGASVGAYELMLSLTPGADDYPDTCGGAQAIGLNSPTSAMLHPNDLDFFEITAPQAGFLTINVRSDDADPVTSLFDDDCSLIAANDDVSPGNLESRIRRAVEAGVYRLGIRHFGVGLGRYELDVNYADSTVVYPQLALGGGFDVTLLVTNNSGFDWTGFAELDEREWPLDQAWSLDGEDRTGETEFPIDLMPGETQRFQLSRTEDAVSGWLKITSTGQLSDISTSFFYNFLTDGSLVDSTGVSPAAPSRGVRFPVERDGQRLRTGVAIRMATAPMTFSLFDEAGVLVQRFPSALFDGALFFDEIFDAPLPDRFTGSMTVESTSPFATTVLRFETTDEAFQLTSVPATPIKNGARLLLHCDPLSPPVDSLVGEGCHSVVPGPHSFVQVYPESEIVLFPSADCTGPSLTLTRDKPLCPLVYDDDSPANDNVGSVLVVPRR